MSTTYVDGTTPLDAAHMNALQQKVEKGANSGYPAIDAAGFILAPNAAGGLKIAGDTNLYRAAANTLKTDGVLQVGQYVIGGFGGVLGNYSFAAMTTADSTPRWSSYNDGSLHWGPGNAAVDTNLYRSAAGVLKTDGNMDASAYYLGGQLAWSKPAAGYQRSGDVVTQIMRNAAGVQALGIGVPTDSTEHLRIDTNGLIQWSPGNAAPDTNLYRSAAGLLRTDGQFGIGGPLYVDMTGGGNKLYFGSAQDTNLYRQGASQLQTDGNFRVAGYLDLAYTNPSAQLRFGSAVDTNLYRAFAGALRTDGQLFVMRGLVVGDSNNSGFAIQSMFGDVGARQAIQLGINGDTAARLALAAGGQISWGPGGTTTQDTNLYRVTTSELRTDNNFDVGQNLWLFSNSGQIAFGSGYDTTLTRPSAGVLAINGTPITPAQKGHSVFAVAANSHSVQTITFPTAFGTAPTVVCSAGSDSDYQGDASTPNPVKAVIIGTPTTTSFQVSVYNNTNSATRNVHVWWMAQ